MKAKTIEMIATITWLGLITAFEARGQLGFNLPGIPQIVTDIETHAYQIEELARMTIEIHNWDTLLGVLGAETAKLSKTQRVGISGATPPFYSPQIPNVFGETAGWHEMMNGRIPLAIAQIAQAWGTVTVPLRPTPPFLGQSSTSSLMRLVSSANIRAGMTQNALFTSANIRAQQDLNTFAIQNLQSTCLGDDFLSADSQSNCTAAAGIINTQQVQTANTIAAASLDMQAAEEIDKYNDRITKANDVGRELQANMERSDHVFGSQALQNTLLRF